MALASGADIRLGLPDGDCEFYLARDVANHYVHTYNPLFAQRLDISGTPGQQNLRPELLMWSYTDWSGGEGEKFYNPSRPNVYFKGVANGRSPGELTSPPDRNFGTHSTAAAPNALFFTAASGSLFMGTGNEPTAAGANHFFASTDGTTWTSKDLGFTTGDVLTALASDGVYVYAVKDDGSNWQIRRYDPDADTSAAFSVLVSSTNQILGMAFLQIAAGGRLYTWNGRILREYDTTASLTVTPSQVYTSGVDKVPNAARGDVIAAENSVVFFYSAEGRSYLTEYGLASGGAARPLWTPPKGFVIKKIAYQLGLVLCYGDYNGKDALFAVPINRSTPIFLGYIRPNSSLTPADIDSSFGSDVTILTTDGHVFVYNLALDSLSELANLSDTGGTFAATTTYKGLRLAAKYNSTTVTTYTWGADDGTLSTTVGSAPEMPAWDFDLPFVDKLLHCFHVNSSSLSSSNTVTISYDLDESGSYTDLTTLTSGKVNISFPAVPVAFRQLRWKITTAGNAKVYAVAAQASVASTTETWDLIIDLRPEALNRSQPDRPDVLRARLIKAREDKEAMQLDDGVPFVRESVVAWDGTSINDGSGNDVQYSGVRTSTVLIEDVQDVAVEGPARDNRRGTGSGYGLLRVRLRKVTLT